VSLEPDIVGTVALGNSLHWHSGSDIEWSVSVETELFVISLSISLTSLVNVNDSPLLMVAIIVAPDSNCLSFIILGSLNIENLLVSPVDELLILVLEDLPPS
jgi:hypothetical protein